MYRKMIFIFFSIFTAIDYQQRTSFLLFFSSLSLLITLKYKPFTLIEMNILEVESNITALITIFSGSLYVLDVGDAFKAIIFALIMLANTNFAFRWVFSVCDFTFKLYENKINKFCPFILRPYHALRNFFEMNYIKQTFNSIVQRSLSYKPPPVMIKMKKDFI